MCVGPVVCGYMFGNCVSLWDLFVCVARASCAYRSVSVYACGVSACHVNEEVALFCAIRAVSLQAGLAIWTHDKEPGPDISHFFFQSLLVLSDFCLFLLSVYISLNNDTLYFNDVTFSLLLLSVFLQLSVYFVLSESLSLSFDSPLLLSPFFLQFAVLWSTRGAMNLSRSAAQGQIRGPTQT